MARPQPTPERLREVLRYEAASGALVWKARPGCGRTDRAGLSAGSPRPDGYLQLQVDGVRLLAHRVVWALVHGVWPAGFIDHIDRVRSNNRVTNLRVVNVRENGQNTSRYKNNRSGAKGVYQHSSGKWEAYFHVAGLRIYLGLYTSFADACAVRRAAVELIFAFPGEA